MKKLRHAQLGLWAVALFVLPAVTFAQAPAAVNLKQPHEQNPKSLYVNKPGVDLGDGSVLYLQSERSIRYWPASGKISEEPLAAKVSWLSTVQKTAAGLVFAGGMHTDERDAEIGDKTVLLIRPDGRTLSAQLEVARFYPTSVRLADDSVLVVGGTTRYARNRHGPDSESARTTAAELINYRDGKLNVARVPDLPGVARRGFRMVTLGDGRVLVMGGDPSWYNSCGGCVADTWLFDPKNRLWQAGPAMKVPRVSFTATRLADGRVLVAGGWSPRSSDADDRVEVFDPRYERWEDFPRMPAPVSGHQAVWLAGEEQKTLLFGGGTNAQIQALDVANRRWTTVGEMQRYRIGAELLSYRDGAGHPWALLFGGINSPRGQNSGDDATVERIPLRTRPVDSHKSGVFPLQRSGVAIAVGLDGRALLAGGRTDGDPGSLSSASVDWLAPDDQSAPVALPALNHAREGAQAFWLPQGRAIVVGGTVSSYNRGDSISLPAEWYDPEARCWTELANADNGRPILHRAGTAYGQFQDGSLLEVVENSASRLIINGGNARRESFPGLSLSRSGNFVARVLRDGRLVVAGGSVQAELIALANEGLEDSLAKVDGPGAGELRRNGQDVYRGYGAVSPSRQHEIYDPATRTWRNSTPARVAGEHAVILDDGRVVKLGELEPLMSKRDTWTPAKILIEMSNPDGTGWHELPLPEQMAPDVRESHLISQSGELFLEGKRNSDHFIMWWWFDEERKRWMKLADWNYSSPYFGPLITAPTRNGKRLVWVGPR